MTQQTKPLAAPVEELFAVRVRIQPHFGLGPDDLQAVAQPHVLELVHPHAVVVDPGSVRLGVHNAYREARLRDALGNGNARRASACGGSFETRCISCWAGIYASSMCTMLQDGLSVTGDRLCNSALRWQRRPGRRLRRTQPWANWLLV